MRAERIQRELEIVRATHGPVETDEQFIWLLLPVWPLPSGWSLAQTPVMILLPPAYPTTPPDNFYTSNTLLASGAIPMNSSSDQVVASGLGPWLMFSFHMEQEDWSPDLEHVERGHTLLTFLDGVRERLGEVE